MSNLLEAARETTALECISRENTKETQLNSSTSSSSSSLSSASESLTRTTIPAMLNQTKIRQGSTEGEVDTDPTGTASHAAVHDETASRLLALQADAMASERERMLLEQEGLVLGILAKQLEYYFSQTNLAKDTYLQTLRSLNDGCVPVTILANFTKVQALLPGRTELGRIHAIRQAVECFSPNALRLFVIDSVNSKIVTDQEDSVDELTTSATTFIVAVGTWDQQPLPAVSVVSTANVASVSASHATIIVRDVPEHVSEEDVRLIFALPDGPSIVSVRQDVAHCWFVTLDIESPGADGDDVTMKVMMHLQAQLLGGEPVKARRKASVASNLSIDPIPFWLPPIPLKRKKKKKRSKKKKKNSSTSGSANSNSDGTHNNINAAAATRNQNQNMPGKGTETASSFHSAFAIKSSIPLVSPPTLGEDNFPTLQDKKVEWETPPTAGLEDDEKYDKHEDDDADDEEDKEDPKSVKALSDVASTATTTSSSTESTPHGKKLWGTVGGYAAALMKQAVVPPPVSETKVAILPVSTESKAGHFSALSHKATAPAPVVTVSTPKWGGIRSFADVLRQEEAQQS
jgi:hypothetical protein